MGVYEIITGITENEENLKVEIRQTEGTLERNLVYIKNTKTNRAYSFTLADGDEYGADAMTRNAVAKLHSDMCGCNEKTLDRIEHALGIKLETWQDTCMHLQRSWAATKLRSDITMMMLSRRYSWACSTVHRYRP